MSSASLQWLYFEIQDLKKKSVNKVCSASLQRLYFEIWDLLSIEQSPHDPQIRKKINAYQEKKKKNSSELKRVHKLHVQADGSPEVPVLWKAFRNALSIEPTYLPQNLAIKNGGKSWLEMRTHHRNDEKKTHLGGWKKSQIERTSMATL